MKYDIGKQGPGLGQTQTWIILSIVHINQLKYR